MTIHGQKTGWTLLAMATKPRAPTPSATKLVEFWSLWEQINCPHPGDHVIDKLLRKGSTVQASLSHMIVSDLLTQFKGV